MDRLRALPVAGILNKPFDPLQLSRQLAADPRLVNLRVVGAARGA